MICQVQKYVKLSRCILAAALLGPGAVSGQDNQTVEIVGYAHDPCEVIDEAGFRQLIYPQYAQHGGKSKSLTSKTGYWNCDTRLNAGILNCKDAASAPRPAWGVSEDVLQSCDAMFESAVSECVSHYEGQRHKCEAYSRNSENSDESEYASALDNLLETNDDQAALGDLDSENSDGSEYASALNNVLETNDYQAALDDLDKKAAQRRQRLEEERKQQVAAARRLEEKRKRQAAEARRLEEERIAKARREQERIARLEAEEQGQDDGSSAFWDTLLGGVAAYSLGGDEALDAYTSMMGALSYPDTGLNSPQTYQLYNSIPSAGDGNSRCNKVVEQTAEKMQNMLSYNTSGVCEGGRKQLKALTYAKDNLSRHGCYSGEYDQAIAKTRNYNASVCVGGN